MARNMKPVALAIACACATSAAAEAIDINKLIGEQLRKTGKLAAGYKAKTGKDLPGNLSPNVVFQGEIGGKGVQFTVPAVIPERPLVVSQAPVTNCSSREVTRRVTVDKSSTVSNTVTNSDTVETGKEISVTVGYESPFGASASTTASLKQSFSATTTKEQQTSDTLAWQDQLEVPVESGKVVKVQFVVTEQRLDRVPYTANLIVRGKAQANFIQGEEGFRWVKIAGSSLPANVIRPGYQQDNRRLGVCRVSDGNRMRIGKSEGTTCWYAMHELAPMSNMLGAKSGKSTGNFEVLVGSDSSVKLGDPYVTDAWMTDNTNGQKVCFVEWDKKLIPGYIEGRECFGEWGSQARHSQNYKVLRAPQTGGVTVDYDLDRDLTEAQRTFNLRGVFTGVNALYGDFRVGPSLPADCGLATAAATAGPGPKTAAASSAPGAQAMKAPAPQAAAATGPVVLAAAAPNEAPLPVKGAKKVVPKRVPPK